MLGALRRVAASRKRDPVTTLTGAPWVIRSMGDQRDHQSIASGAGALITNPRADTHGSVSERAW